ncbi:hypothetical protein V6N12_025560 [Hibiscus sabdariffa]|uniref:Uncharacterized protein n=1 Tax=Hibiscus sabdariffa TaxID=183260 RepID=A0ABR2CJB2_9ROSI
MGFSWMHLYSIDINRNPHVPLPNSQQNSGVNNLVPIAQAPPPVEFCTFFCSNEANQASRSRSIVVAMSSVVYVPSGSVVATGLTTDSLPYLVSNGVSNADEKPRIAPNVHVEPETENLHPKELPLLDNFVELTSAAENGDGAEEEVTTDLDLSLHL